MTDLIVLLLFNSFFIMGVYAITQEGMIFGFIRKAFIKSGEDDLEEEYHVPWLYKPLIGCPTCMASIHSFYFYWLFNEWTLEKLWIYPLYAIALAGLNSLFHKYLDTI